MRYLIGAVVWMIAGHAQAAGFYAPLGIHLGDGDKVPGLYVVIGDDGICDRISATSDNRDWVWEAEGIVAIRSTTGSLAGTFEISDADFSDPAAPPSMAYAFYALPKRSEKAEYSWADEGSVTIHPWNLSHRDRARIDMHFRFADNGPNVPESTTLEYCANLEELTQTWR